MCSTHAERKHGENHAAHNTNAHNGSGDRLVPVVPAAMFRVRIVDIDYYMGAPAPHLDVGLSEFFSIKPYRVPIIRVFGTTPAGQKCCLHVHRCFPYLFVPLDADLARGCLQLPNAQVRVSSTVDSFLRAFGDGINSVLEQTAKNNEQPQRWDVAAASSNRPYPCASSSSSFPSSSSSSRWARKRIFVQKLSIVFAIPFYGYHAHAAPFVRIDLLEPAHVSTLAELLASGAVLGRPFQRCEAHIPYILQFMSDYNLFGMNWLDLHTVTFRRPLPAARDVNVSGITVDPLAAAPATASASASASPRVRARSSSASRRCADAVCFPPSPTVPPASAAATAARVSATATATATVSTEMDTLVSPRASSTTDTVFVPRLSALSLPLRKRHWTASTTPTHLLASVYVSKATTCALEVDCCMEHILNRVSLFVDNIPYAQRERGGGDDGGKKAAAGGGVSSEFFSQISNHIQLSQLPDHVKIVRSLAIIWDSERRRRAKLLQQSPECEQTTTRTLGDSQMQEECAAAAAAAAAVAPTSSVRASEVQLTPLASPPSGRRPQSPLAIQKEYRENLQQLVDLQRAWLLAVGGSHRPQPNVLCRGDQEGEAEAEAEAGGVVRWDAATTVTTATTDTSDAPPEPSSASRGAPGSAAESGSHRAAAYGDDSSVIARWNAVDGEGKGGQGGDGDGAGGSNTGQSIAKERLSQLLRVLEQAEPTQELLLCSPLEGGGARASMAQAAEACGESESESEGEARDAAAAVLVGEDQPRGCTAEVSGGPLAAIEDDGGFGDDMGLSSDDERCVHEEIEAAVDDDWRRAREEADERARVLYGGDGDGDGEGADDPELHEQERKDIM